ncbi:MAG: alkaline phosphatase family protein [Aeromicrobium sp.]
MPKLRIADFVRMTMAWAINALALIAAAAVLPGLNADSKWRFVVVAAVTGVFGVVVRPVLATLAAHVGWILIVAVAVAGQAVTMHLALLVVPGVTANSFWTLVAATWIAATISTILTWLATAGTDESFDSALLRFAGKGAVLEDPDVDGIVFVQFDGVPFPVAQWALNSGSMPTIRRWVDQGSHRLDEWTAQLPCTTPASQLGILHGTCARVPAFRWYDRELGRVLVANRPEDAAVIEKRATNGKGLLADRGVSVSNLFSGDAEKCMMTMSRVSVGRGTLDTRRTFARFVVRPDGLARSVARTIAEVASERFQARRQRRRDVLPRVERSWTYAFLRASSNGVLHDLNTALVSQEMFRGARSIYVDFVDYDEVAHHAGVNRVESLRVLETLDQTLSTLERIAGHAPRHYHFVVLSDHGQSQGTPFEERHGASLSGVCAKLAGESVSSEEENVESWGRAGSVLDDLGGEEEFGGKAATNAASRIHERTAQTAKGSPEKDLVVLGSGNLGLVYVQSTTRLMLEDLETRWPRLVTGLAGHPGIAFVCVLSQEHGPLVIGAGGTRQLLSGKVTGVDPLANFPDHAASEILHAVQMPEAPEIYVNSTFDASTQEVAAFEALVGSHGGLGGWQDRAMLLTPTALSAAGPSIRGAEQVHRHLTELLVQLGHRSSLDRV